MVDKNPSSPKNYKVASASLTGYSERARKGATKCSSKIPNAESREAIRQAQTGEGLASYDSIKEMLADLNNE